jgi:hypothetical protein
MGVLRFPEWQELCENALLEPDPEKLFQRIIVAETAIFHRLQDSTGRLENVELEAMDDVLNRLRCLIENTFMLPDGQERATARPVQAPIGRSRPNEKKRRTQPLAQTRIGEAWN